MKFLALHLAGFKSFVQETTLNVAEMPPGLYHVHGRNEVEPELEAGGAGKSTLFDAVEWGLYGKTSRGLRAGAVVNWAGQGECYVATEWIADGGIAAYKDGIDIQYNDRRVTVYREQSPNRLELAIDNGEGAPTDQQTIDGWLLPQTVFRHCMHFAQFADSFVDLSAAEQSAIFTDVLKLGVWDAAAKNAAEFVRGCDGQLVEMTRDHAYAYGALEELAKHDYAADEAAWDKVHKKDVQRAKADCAIQEEQETLTRVRVGAARVAVVEYKEAKAKEDENGREMVRLEAAEIQAQRTLDKLEKDNYTNCPTCGAPVTRAHVEKEIKAAERVLEQVSKALGKVCKESDRLFHAHKKLKAQNDRLIEAEREHAVAQMNARQADAVLKQLSAQTNPWTAERIAADKRGNELAATLDKLEADMAAAHADKGDAAFWVKGFREIRLSLINESLSQLTVEANEVLYQMGLKDWSIEFDVERETKSGTVSKNFTVLIHSPHTEQAVPWEAWCGGETQRLRIAIAMGFANLIGARMGLQPNLEMWDEPTGGLPDVGVHALLQVLVDRAKRQNKVILLADHHSFDFGGFAGVITIVKTDKGSEIQW